MKNYTLVLLAILCSSAINAQSIKINGQVTDESAQPLPGVEITLKGSKTTTHTDFDGYYEISAETGDLLEFSFIGYEKEEVLVGITQVINVAMIPKIGVLEEVVVIGYGTQKKHSITSAVTMVSSKAMEKKNRRKAYHQELVNQLQGKVSGVQITMVEDIEIVEDEVDLDVDAVNQTAPKSIEPLYIVDGTPIAKQNNKVIAQLTPDQIDKMKVYKGKKAKQLFGEVANEGCIVITTKKGNYQIENDENYAHLSENAFERVDMKPLSTFSIDVDKAGYSNVRRLINNGQTIPVSAVKIEEMVNYFQYSYAQPTGEHPFSIHTEAAQTPWNDGTKLVRIGLQGKKYTNEALPASNLTFLIDVSGSMSDANKLPLLKSAFKLLVNQLRKKDKVAIVVYAGAAGVVLPPTSGNEKEKILSALNHLEAGGSTAGGAGIELAYKLAEKNFKHNGNNRVILATDGDFNVGASDNNAMEELIEEKRASGVFLSVLGFGMGNYKDSKLELLADKGNGNHAYIDSMQEAQKVFGKEFGGTLYTIAKDVKIQVEFNPTQVQAYRLVGYENRLLADEDFVDDTKDAGELGSGHTVTAIYEIVPVGIKSDYIKEGIGLKYTSVAKETRYSDELLTVKFRYKKPQGEQSIVLEKILDCEVSEMSKDFKFAASVALFGMHLRKSAYTNNTKIKDIVALAEAGRGEDQQGYRAEFIRLVQAATLDQLQ